jgi:WD40 repeat protein
VAVDTIHLVGHTRRVLSGAFIKDGSQVATVSHDHTVRVWDATTGAQQKQYTGPINERWETVEFNPNGRQVAVAGDSIVHEYALATDHWRGIVMWIGKSYNSGRYDSTGFRMVTSCSDSTAHIWDHTEAIDSLMMTLVGHRNVVLDARYSPDNSKILTCSADSTARLWDVATGLELRRINRFHAVTGAVFNVDGRWIATAADSLNVWDAATGELVLSWLPPGADSVSSASFNPTNGTIAAAVSDSVVILDVATGRQVWSSGKLSGVIGVVFSPTGDRLLVTGEDGLAMIYHFGASSGVQEDAMAGFRLALGQSRPNPVQDVAEIPFELWMPGHVRITVADRLGREVATVLDADLEPGAHSMRFDASELVSGSYFYTLQTSEGRISRRLDVMK